MPAIIDQSIILNLRSESDCPPSDPENENNPRGKIPENENIGKIIVDVNTDCSHLVWDIKNSFSDFLILLLRR